MKPRNPQLPLRLDADTPDKDGCWHTGGTVLHLGVALRLVLDTACRESTRVMDELHLPLPPAATPRQIRDAAESWLRDEALCNFSAIVAQKSALAGRHGGQPIPPIVLTFGKRSDWVRIENQTLRCHWRLIEQSLPVIEQVLGRALASLQPATVCDDLFALV
jgi:hypothetical protein